MVTHGARTRSAELRGLQSPFLQLASLRCLEGLVSPQQVALGARVTNFSLWGKSLLGRPRPPYPGKTQPPFLQKVVLLFRLHLCGM